MSNPVGLIGVLALDASAQSRAEALAAARGWHFLDADALHSFQPARKEPAWPQAIALGVGGDGLDLRALDAPKLTPLRVDFLSGELIHRRAHGGGKGQMIARACGLRGHESRRILDATFGLGRDAFVLATLGADVQGIERVPAIYELSADGLGRAKVGGDEIFQRLHLVCGESKEALRDQIAAFAPDTLYLDPMYPGHGPARGALPGKEMRLLRPLAGDDDDADGLLRIGLAYDGLRVVVKRPKKAPLLGGMPPHHQHVGKSTRFDVYFGGGGG